VSGSVDIRVITTPPQRMVALAVTTTVKAMTDEAARRRLDRRDTAQMSKRCFFIEPGRVVSSGDQQRTSGVGAHAVDSDQLRGGVGDQRGEQVIESCDLSGQILGFAGQLSQRLSWSPRPRSPQYQVAGRRLWPRAE
jgi:hypothetical protein